jgi:hypothetical protein
MQPFNPDDPLGWRTRQKVNDMVMLKSVDMEHCHE